MIDEAFDAFQDESDEQLLAFEQAEREEQEYYEHLEVFHQQVIDGEYDDDEGSCEWCSRDAVCDCGGCDDCCECVHGI